MKSVGIKRILEYKEHEKTHYVLVEWEDGQISWARLANLNCKDLLRSFFKTAISILTQEERASEREEQKRKEEDLLNKILSQNLEESAKAKATQAQAVSEFMKSATAVQKIEKMANEETKQPFIGLNNHPALNRKMFMKELRTDSKDVPNVQKRPLSKNLAEPFLAEKSNFPKRQEITTLKNNSMTLCVSPTLSLSLVFFYKETHPPIIFEEKNIVVIDQNRVLTYLYSLYISQFDKISIFPSHGQDLNTEIVAEEYFKPSHKLAICKAQASYWIVSPRYNFPDLFRFPSKAKFLIFKIDALSYIDKIFKFRGIISQGTQWAKSIFKYGISTLTDAIVKDSSNIQSKNVFMVDDTRSALAMHFKKASLHSSRIVDSISAADVVLIHENSLKFLHFVPGFYLSLRSPVKFFVMKFDRQEEILPSGGLVTFSEQFIMDSELLRIADLIDVMNVNTNWKLKIARPVYNILKQRLGSQNTAPEYLYKLKIIYNEFKNGVVEYFGSHFRDYLEMNYYKSHRHFLEISSYNEGHTRITIEEVTKIVLSG